MVWRGTSLTVNPTATTTYTVSVTATKGTCTATDTRNVEVTVTPKVDPVFASLQDNYCAGTTPTLPTTSDNGITGTWATTASSTSPDFINQTCVFTPATGECANPFEKTVKIYSTTPSAGSITPNIVVCDGTTTYTFNNATSASGGINGQYAWQASLNGTDGWVTIPSANAESYAPMTDLTAISTASSKGTSISSQ